ncbi:PleD family two-component system response regulator [Thiomicrospira microaerophila]|uniref:diguanylate cyclase n=1 Tax=Thiomicrospira microaerophila TaxID=406020 RepID=UPI00200DA9D4|nr:PleD family two-component system response regulator [Thiomicrospira microaerophila]UQB42102.1 PleD family two-component system response regulator [Thiomicrospira microaerophila]
MSHDQQTILIVDDIASDIQMLANALQDDYRIIVATQGWQAIQMASSECPPDLILLDIMMPDMDGYSICKQLKSDPKTMGIPVVFVTALQNNEDQERGLNIGAVDYIIKPFHLPIVKARLRNHMLLKMKTDQLEELSHLDGLTGIANRRHFDEVLSKEQSRLQRSGGTLSLIMLDIDFFKPFNDNYGHGTGDECLTQVARALSRVVKRPTDLLARYGGEEFAVILPDTDLEGAMLVAKSLHAEVNRLAIPHAYSKVFGFITISLGVANLSSAKTKEPVYKLLKRADDALYKAKELGRNRICVAEKI